MDSSSGWLYWPILAKDLGINPNTLRRHAKKIFNFDLRQCDPCGLGSIKKTVLWERSIAVILANNHIVFHCIHCAQQFAVRLVHRHKSAFNTNSNLRKAGTLLDLDLPG